MEIVYRIAEENDLEEVYNLVACAIKTLEKDGIFQWDEFYPTRNDLMDDIKKRQLRVGSIYGKIAVIYVLNKEYDKEYETGSWLHPDRDYSVIHRLCVNPQYQKMGIAKKTLKHIEEELAEDGIFAIRLDAYSLNPYALALYSHFGYKKVGQADWRKGRFYLMEKYFD